MEASKENEPVGAKELVKISEIRLLTRSLEVVSTVGVWIAIAEEGNSEDTATEMGTLDGLTSAEVGNSTLEEKISIEDWISEGIEVEINISLEEGVGAIEIGTCIEETSIEGSTNVWIEPSTEESLELAEVGITINEGSSGVGEKTFEVCAAGGLIIEDGIITIDEGSRGVSSEVAGKLGGITVKTDDNSTSENGGEGLGIAEENSLSEEKTSGSTVETGVLDSTKIGGAIVVWEVTGVADVLFLVLEVLVVGRLGLISSEVGIADKVEMTEGGSMMTTEEATKETVSGSAGDGKSVSEDTAENSVGWA